MEPIIKVDNVSMCFNLSKEKHESLKEYFLAMVQGRLQYDEFYALKDVSLDIMPGDFYGLVGLNGSGKSTLLKTIAGVYKPSKGKVTVNGTIAPLIELGAGFDMDLTARENIYLNGTVLGFSPKYLDEKFDEIVEFSELENFLDVPLKNYSSGMVAHFKPDYAPDYLLCCNYICHLAVFQKALWEQLGGERPKCDGSQDHDLFLRLLEKTGGAAHVPQVLYYWRVHAGSTSGGADAKPYVAAAAKKALTDHLTRTGRTGTVEDGLFPSTYRVKWDIVGEPKVSILIPNKDHTEDLEKCLHSIWTKTAWEHFEVIVVENNSTDPATFAYYKKAQQRYDGLRVVTYPQKGFNLSGINNFGRKYATGEYLLLLNNDVEVRGSDWLTELLRQCAHPGGAAVCGAMLYYPDETIQHAGVITGLGGYAGHSHKYKKAGGSGYMFRTATVQDFSAVTGACLLVKTSVWDKVKGLDEAFAVAFNDVDFCLRVRDAGYRIAWTPYAQLTHYESKSRGGDEKDPVKARRFAAEQQRLYEVHGKANILHDPYYNPNLTMDREDFSESDDLRGLKEGRITVQWRE